MPALWPASLLWSAPTRRPQQKAPGGGGRQTPRVAKQNSGTISSKATPATIPETPQSPLATPSPLHPTNPTPSAQPTPSDDGHSLLTRSSATHTVTFADEDQHTSSTQNVNDGSRATRPADPTRDGYLFDGWFTGDIAYDFNQPVTKDITVQAHWTSKKGSWNLSPWHGPSKGGNELKLRQPTPRGLKFTQISTGDRHTLAIGSDGNTYGWGSNDYGQLGDGTLQDHYTPQLVAFPQSAHIIQVSAGMRNSLALDDQGHIWAWGRNDSGQLGLGDRTRRTTPTMLDASGGTHYEQVCTREQHSMALDSDGNAWAWGAGLYGRLGIGDTTNSYSPVKVLKPDNVPSSFKFTQISVTYYRSLALGNDGNAYAWGDARWGQIGNGSSDGSYNKPVKVSKPANVDASTFSYTQISAGYVHSLALGSNGEVYAWGVNDNASLGDPSHPVNNNSEADGPHAYVAIPSKVVHPAGAPSTFRFTQVNAGYKYSLAIGNDGEVYGWGSDADRQLGVDESKKPSGGYNWNTPFRAMHPANVSEPFTYQAISSFGNTTLVIGSDGYAYGWGRNDFGNLGNTNNRAPSTQVMQASRVIFPESANLIRALFDGASVSYSAMQTDQQGNYWSLKPPAHATGWVKVVISWSMNGPQTDATLSYKYDGADHAVNFAKGCTDCTVSGMPAQQSITDGNQASRPYPDPSRDGFLFDGWFLKDAEGDSNVAYDFSQPVTGDITLVAHWSPADTGGWSISPDKGNVLGGQQTAITPPKLSRGIRFSQISAGTVISGFSVGVASDGNVYAWGANDYGQLGQDPDKMAMQKTPTRVPLPDGVASGFTYTQVAAGDAHVVAIGSDQIVYAWGANDQGQLGNGSQDRNTHPSPMPVKGADGQPFKAVQVSAGAGDSAAISPDGRVYTWGSEIYANYSSSPRLTPTLAKDPNGSGQGLHAVQVSVNWSFIMALDADGNVYTWGFNNYGQLGNGTATGDDSDTYAADPARVPDPEDTSKAFKATQISAGGSHALAIGQDGTLWAWGYDADAQLGDGGKNKNRSTPMQVQNPKDSSQGFKVAWISAGVNQTIIGDENGTAWAWGINNWGQLGINSTNDTQDTPAQMSPPAGQDNPARGFTPAKVSAGALHGLAIGQDGNAYSWGSNWYGELGNTSIPTGLYVHAAESLVPVPVMLGQLLITGVKFDQAMVGSLQQNADGSVTLATPTHNPGLADVIVDWSLGGVSQTQAHLAYTYEGVLPLTGGNGSMVLLLAAGLLAAAGAAAAGRHRRETRALHV
ncbi:InlB B-repeat-containing protein [Bifidobacterium sp. H6bp22N]|uniref:RCC1 domain-containing protein n=1 Tax=Bifidobacterium polysaccharolyticum TaxID=2750967 RepID=UPI0028BE76B9|nr:InlB B-repeat-containing protein [Bifidobacterium sp. H6bp22N]MDT7506833.1 InlB B-repeat-containing protein [Bifidobacterium sp. H6bp22N]